MRCLRHGNTEPGRQAHRARNELAGPPKGEFRGAKQEGTPVSAPSRTFEFEFAVEPTHPALPGHFPGHPIVPGVLLLDHVLSAVIAELKRPVSVLKQVKFVAALLPGESAMVNCDACGDSLSFTVKTRRAGVLGTLASGQATLAHGPTALAHAAQPGAA